MNKLINFIESEWSRPAIVCFVVFLFCFFAFFLSLAEKREANRIEKQTESWIEQGYPIKSDHIAPTGPPVVGKHIEWTSESFEPPKK